MTTHRLEAVLVPTEARWVVDGLIERSIVNSLVPQGFPAHARIFHPAWRCELKNGRLWKTPLTWSQVASMRDRTAHGLMQWSRINVLPILEDPVADLLLEVGYTIVEHPAEGSLPVEVATPLAQVLERHTSAPDLCWFGAWDGFGRDYKDEIAEPKATITTIQARRWHLFRGPLKAIEAGLFQSGIAHQSANLLWPDDHS